MVVGFRAFGCWRLLGGGVPSRLKVLGLLGFGAYGFGVWGFKVLGLGV